MSGSVVGGARLRHRWTDEGVRPTRPCSVPHEPCSVLTRAVLPTLHVLEREAGAQLEFAAWGHGHGDGAELGRVHEAVGGAKVDHV